MNIDMKKIKQIMKKHAPEKLDPTLLVGAVFEATRVFSEEYKEEMRIKHPDWYKTES